MSSSNDPGKVLESEDQKTHFRNSNSVEAGVRQMKTMHDGLRDLNPQPSDNVNDPLNWTVYKKMAILLTVSATAFLADFGSSTGAVTSVVQSNSL